MSLGPSDRSWADARFIGNGAVFASLDAMKKTYAGLTPILEVVDNTVDRASSCRDHAACGTGRESNGHSGGDEEASALSTLRAAVHLSMEQVGGGAKRVGRRDRYFFFVPPAAGAAFGIGVALTIASR